MIRRPVAALALALALGAAACGGSGPAAQRSPFPSGSLGPVTPAASAEAVRGLCAMAGATDLATASATFYDRSHEELHVIAAATQVTDRAAAARLLEAKESVEADLAGTALPDAFGGHLDALLAATRDALEAIGLSAPACPT